MFNIQFRWVATLAIALLISTTSQVTAQKISSDKDDDGDGLSNFHETYKYFTDPKKKDSDGDSIPDGDWNERREYAYTIRVAIKVLRPIHKDILNGDRQDGRIISQTDDYLEIEFVLYPFNCVSKSIKANPTWQSDDSYRQYVKPGPTTNWDQTMRKTMISKLHEAGIHVRRLDDVQTVKKVSRWLMNRVEHLNSSCYAIIFKDQKPSILPEHLNKFRSIMWDKNGSIDDQFQRELYGKGMFENKLTGSCTSCANYLTTGLRAIGIPTRMIRSIPIVDCSDPAQVKMVKNAITHQEVRDAIMPAITQLGSSFAGHTYNEVYVGGRWRRLNYTKLGQNNLDKKFMGLMIHIDRYDDLANSKIGERWGRWLKQQRHEPFVHNNPYRTMEISEQFAKHE